MLPGNTENVSTRGERSQGIRNGAGQTCDAGPPRGAVMTRSRSSVAEGEQLGDRGPVAGGPGGDRAGGPAQQEHGKLAAAETVRSVQVQGAACDLGGVIATAPLRGAALPCLDGFRRLLRD